MVNSERKHKSQYKSFFMRPQIPTKEYDAFQAACSEVGETMTGILRRVITKIGNGDRELLDRIRL